MIPRTRRLAGLFLAILVLGLVARAAVAGAPSTVIEDLNAKFLEAMKGGPTLGFDGRYKLLEPTLDAAFNFADMARVSTGRYWKDFSDDQKTRLVAAFRDYSISNYASQFKDFSGEKFEVLDEQASQQNAVRVNSQIVKGDGEAVRIDYLLQPADDHFRIIDIFLESSISQLAVRRSEFRSVLASGGGDGLIAALKDKSAQLTKDGQ